MRKFAQGIAVTSFLWCGLSAAKANTIKRYNGKPGLCAQKCVITIAHPTITKTNVKRVRISEYFD